MTYHQNIPIDWSLAESWYDTHADAFEMATLSMKVPPFMRHFAQMVPLGAPVLDAGCGAGRDTRWLLDQGYDVGAFDISQEMVSATHLNTGGRVSPRKLDFRDFDDTPGSWQGIWALASLLHLPRKDVPDVLERLLKSLTDDGVLAFAVKRGDGEKLDGRGRPMSFFEAGEICQMVFEAMPGKGEIKAETVVLPDSGGHQTAWINVTARRIQSL
jgi:predicted TPR repeat methyltransferase